MKEVAMLLDPGEVGVCLSALIGLSQSVPDEELADELTSALVKFTKVYNEIKLRPSS
jgi:hypothetical protein